MKIYYNPKCSKCRTALTILEKRNIEFEGVKYLEVGISSNEVLEISKILGVSVHEMVRTKEDSYIQFDIDWSDDDHAAKAIEESPILLERPIIIDGDRAIIARPAELLEEFLDVL